MDKQKPNYFNCLQKATEVICIKNKSFSGTLKKVYL